MEYYFWNLDNCLAVVFGHKNAGFGVDLVFLSLGELNFYFLEVAVSLVAQVFYVLTTINLRIFKRLVASVLVAAEGFGHSLRFMALRAAEGYHLGVICGQF